jgi:Na+-transporting NADH:ubiquinone oxidoreductase subunit B
MRAVFEGLFDRVRPPFEEGGKFRWAWPLHEGAETFFLTPGEKTESGAHVRDQMDMKRLMIFVVYALVPCILMGWYNIGHQAFLAEGLANQTWIDCLIRGGTAMFPIIMVSYMAGGAAELLFCIVRDHEINEGFLVTGILFPLTLPPTIPLWMVAAGIIFGVVIGKEVFGGVGMNILNPALTARAFVFFTYPAEISGAKIWDVAGPQAGQGHIANQWFGTNGAALSVDAYSGATPLLATANGPAGGDSVAILAENNWGWMDMFMGSIPGSMGEVSAAAAIVGAIFLVVTRIASLRIMVGAVLGVVAMASLLNVLAGPESVAMMTLPAHYHLVMGGFAFGAVFMATDPCSSAATPRGRWIYGFMIGVLVVIIRVLNPAYPEGTMLAILFMNVFAPLIDHYVVKASTRRRIARMAA